MHSFSSNYNNSGFKFSTLYDVSADQKAGVLKPKSYNLGYYPISHKGQEQFLDLIEFTAPPVNPKFLPEQKSYGKQIQNKVKNKQAEFQNQPNKNADFPNLSFVKPYGLGQQQKSDYNYSSINKNINFEAEQIPTKSGQPSKLYNNQFGSLNNNNFGSFNNNLGASNNNFGSFNNNFGPSNNNFGSFNNNPGSFNYNSFLSINNNNLQFSYDSFGSPLKSFGSINNSFGQFNDSSHLSKNTFAQPNANSPTFSSPSQPPLTSQPNKEQIAFSSLNVTNNLQNVSKFVKPEQNSQFYCQNQVGQIIFAGSLVGIKDLKKIQNKNSEKQTQNNNPAGKQLHKSNSYNQNKPIIKNTQLKQIAQEVKKTHTFPHLSKTYNNQNCHQSSYESEQHNEQNKLILIQQKKQGEKSFTQISKPALQIDQSMLKIDSVIKQTQKPKLVKINQQKTQQFCNANRQKLKQKSRSMSKSQEVLINFDDSVKQQTYYLFNQPNEQNMSQKSQIQTIIKLQDRIKQLQFQNNQFQKIIQNLSSAVKNLSQIQKNQNKSIKTT